MNTFEKANKLFSDKNYFDAITTYEKSIKENIEKCTSLYNIGVCYIKLKEYEKAIDYLKQAIELNYTKAIYFFNLGYCYALLKDKKKALINFNRAWALDNNDTDCEKAISLILKKYIRN